MQSAKNLWGWGVAKNKGFETRIHLPSYRSQGLMRFFCGGCGSGMNPDKKSKKNSDWEFVSRSRVLFHGGDFQIGGR